MKRKEEEKMPFMENGGTICIHEISLEDETKDVAVEIVEKIAKALDLKKVPHKKQVVLAVFVRDYLEKKFGRV